MRLHPYDDHAKWSYRCPREELEVLAVMAGRACRARKEEAEDAAKRAADVAERMRDG